ncbi:hypothetical protein HNR00_004177 [Methylorubrum rhodinum]|uniref:Uncharacterized protein n=1 Tax=Methylorubrum rhodinum TaxID=29428 RepID=A0A840ZRX0_9HYPH|nr:hypothetical protein [Methylorubrum rhodinum]
MTSPIGSTSPRRRRALARDCADVVRSGPGVLSPSARRSRRRASVSPRRSRRSAADAYPPSRRCGNAGLTETFEPRTAPSHGRRAAS